MPRFDLATLEFGTAVHDMHNSFPDVEDLFGPRAYVAQDLRLAVPGGSKLIQAIIAARAEAAGLRAATYVNKMLVLIGIDDTASHGAVWQFAYSYDDRYTGIIGIAFKN